MRDAFNETILFLIKIQKQRNSNFYYNKTI